MLIKRIFIVFVFIFFASTTVAAEPCQDLKAVVDEAIKARNAQVKATYNAAIIDPAEDRSSLLSCLGSINSLGNMFSMGVTLPNFQSLLDKVCNSIDSAIQNKINEAMAQLEQTATQNLGGINPFHVNIDGESIVDDLIGKIR